MKISNLERMRMAREERERPTVQPILNYVAGVEESLRTERLAGRALQEQVSLLSRAITSELGRSVIEQIKADLAEEYRPLIESVLAGGEPVRATIPLARLRFFLNPVDDLLAEIARKIDRAAFVSALAVPGDKAQTIRITVDKVTAERLYISGDGMPTVLDRDAGAVDAISQGVRF